MGLSELEKSQIEELKKRVSDIPKPRCFDDDDYVYYSRWLIAREWDIDKAEAMIRKSHEFREKMGTDLLIDTYKPPEVLQKYYIGGVMGYDKAGSPVWLEPFPKLDTRGLLQSVTKEQVKLHKMHTCESLLWLLKSQTEKTGQTVDSVTIVFDLTGLGWKHLYAPGIELFKEVITVFEDNYPELLKVTYILNAPKLFVLAYNLIKGVLSTRTTGKVHVLGSNWQEVLRNVIDPDDLPKAYGGNKVDENGDPYYSAHILYGGDVPKKYYSSSANPTDDLPTVVVPRGSYKLIDYEISVDRCKLSYQVKSDKHDIGIGLLYKPLHSDISKPDKMETLMPVQRYNTHEEPKSGVIECHKPGIYVLMLDNSFSWTKGKTVRYSVEVTSLGEDNSSFCSALDMTSNDEPVTDFL